VGDALFILNDQDFFTDIHTVSSLERGRQKMHSTGKQNDPHVIEQENPFINPTVTYRKRDKT
jgi:hypothetical protein